MTEWHLAHVMSYWCAKIGIAWTGTGREASAPQPKTSAPSAEPKPKTPNLPDIANLGTPNEVTSSS